MFEKVNPAHPDKVADRIAGAIVDLAYAVQENPKVAVEVLIGHGTCHAIIETSAPIDRADVAKAIVRIGGNLMCNIVIVPQDAHLARNQADSIRCGDNGIFKGVPVTDEQKALVAIAKDIYKRFPFDGKYIVNEADLIICQSNAETAALKVLYPNGQINPLGDWTGGTDVDTGATNRKLGSDMADSVTGGGLHGKDLSKADVSVNIYLRNNRIHIFVDALRGIGSPKYVCFLIADDGKTLILAPYKKKDFHSHRVPQDVYHGKRSLELASIRLCQLLAVEFGWDSSKSYRIPGRLVEDNKIVIFDLPRATIIGEEKTD